MPLTKHARPGKGTGSRQEGSAASAASPQQVPTANWPTASDGSAALDAQVHGMGEAGSALRTAGARSYFLDYVHEVDHAAARIERLDLAIAEAVKSVPPNMRRVIEALQALRGIAQVSAVTIVSELGEISRFPGARQLMGYGGIVASEHSSGEGTRRGGITKTGNAHLRRHTGR